MKLQGPTSVQARMRRLLVCAILLLPSAAFALRAMPAYYPACQEIVQSKELTDDQKIAKLRQLLRDQPATLQFGWVYQVDKERARAEAAAMVRDPNTPRRERLALGRRLIELPGKESFADEYTKLLIALALDGGQAEFLSNLSMSQFTAVGELSFMANGFEGLDKKQFDQVRDPRLIPIFIGALDAPDHNYGTEGDTCIVMGNPGQPSGRNTQRQHLPIALVRLNATQAVPSLVQIAQTHHDIYLRSNAAYAVAVLGQPADRKAVETFLRDNSTRITPATCCLSSVAACSTVATPRAWNSCRRSIGLRRATFLRRCTTPRSR